MKDRLRRGGSSAALDKLINAADKLQKKSFAPDETFWQPTVDKAGNGYAIIRFLPAPEGEDTPWVQYWDHGFQGASGRWYIEMSRTTLGDPDPVSEANSILWNSGNEDDKTIARDRKRRLHFVSNIKVISDPANPDNNGKCFKFKYGKKIFDKVIEAMKPEFEDETPINPFDFFEGANFKLKIRNVEGYRNYDKSEFDKVSELDDGDEAKLNEILDNLYSLSEIISNDKFKPYAELKTKFNSVIGESEAENSRSTADRISLDEKQEPKKEKTKEAEYDTSLDAEGDDIDLSSSPLNAEEDANDDDTLQYFAKLASRD